MGDKATNKAMAIAYKYVCFQVFCIPTEDMSDPDAENLEGEIANPYQETKKTKGQKKEPETEQNVKKAEVNSNSDVRIDAAMLQTIRAEQKRTGVADRVILSRKSIKAKKIEEMTVEEFKIVMEIFKKTPDLERGGKDD